MGLILLSVAVWWLTDWQWPRADQGPGCYCLSIVPRQPKNLWMENVNWKHAMYKYRGKYRQVATLYYGQKYSWIQPGTCVLMDEIGTFLSNFMWYWAVHDVILRSFLLAFRILLLKCSIDSLRQMSLYNALQRSFIPGMTSCLYQDLIKSGLRCRVIILDGIPTLTCQHPTYDINCHSLTG